MESWNLRWLTAELFFSLISLIGCISNVISFLLFLCLFLEMLFFISNLFICEIQCLLRMLILTLFFVQSNDINEVNMCCVLENALMQKDGMKMI